MSEQEMKKGLARISRQLAKKFYREGSKRVCVKQLRRAVMKTAESHKNGDGFVDWRFAKAELEEMFTSIVGAPED